MAVSRLLHCHEINLLKCVAAAWRIARQSRVAKLCGEAAWRLRGEPVSGA